jgi:hypothetical protein
MTSNNYFNYEGCYRRPTVPSDTEEFETNLRDKFSQTSVSSVKDCENLALKNNSDFFLINDITSALNSTNTNCYIPKITNTNQSLYGDDSLITKSKELFNSLFFKNKYYIKQSQTPPLSSDLMYNQNRTNKLCFKYSADEQIYTHKNYYAYYTKPILNEKNIALMGTIDSPDFYKNNLAQLKSYEELLKIDNVKFEDSGPLTNAFKNFICNPNTANERLLDTQIYALNLKYENLYNSLNTITKDLSSISYLNSFDDETIRGLNLNINIKSKELSSLLASGGANNGRLDDTTLLTQFKIVENSILLLLIVGAIFYFTKKKNSV